MTTRGTGPLFLFIFAILVCGGTAAAQGGAMAMANGASNSSTGQTRTYYIAADEVTWDYAPGSMNRITGQSFGEPESPWVANGPHRIGKDYKKALYREYTDGTFSRLKPRPKEWEHLGFLGPLLRAEVGDTIKVAFKNNLHFPVSLHPHGVFYEKDSEGAPYHDGSGGESKGAVPPGTSYTYTWPVSERAGPAHGDMSSVLWMYHSHVNEVADVNAGLVGAMIVTARGMSKPDGTPKDVDRELIVAFAEVGETESHYIQENMQTYMGDPKGRQTGPRSIWRSNHGQQQPPGDGRLGSGRL